MVFLDSSLLIIESSVKNSTIYQDYLRSTDRFYDLLIVETISEGLDLCRTSLIDGVLLGRSVSEVDRLAFLESLAEEPNREQPFVVIVASDDDARSAVRALKLGAQDYLLERDLTPELLQSAFQSPILRGRGSANDKARLQLELQECNDRFRIAIDITDRKQTELALQASEERLQLAIEGAQLGTYDWNLVTDLILTSAYFNQLMGLAPDAEFTLATWESIVHPEDFVSANTLLERAFADLADLSQEYRVIWPDGSIHWIGGFGRFYCDSTGRPVRLTGWITDITDRQIAAAALQASEQRYKALIDITAQIVWNADADGTILSSNAGTFTGQSQEEFQGWGWMEAIHPEDRQRTTEVWMLAVANLTLYELEHRLRRWDGEYRLMSSRAVPLLDPDGSVREWVGLHTDITEIRQDEQNLRRSEEFNRRILENNQDCIKVLDLEGRLVYMNDNGKKLLEIADFADYDRSLWTQFWGGSEQDLAQAAFTAATAGIVSKFEGRCPTVTGVAKCWEVSVIPLRHADGHVEQILAISHDVTERRQVEDELRQAQALAQRQLVEIEAIYQTAPIGLTTIDVDFRFQRVNQRLAEMNGVTIEDHIGRTVREVIGDLADGNEPLLRRVLETGEPLLNLELSGETNAQPGIYRTWIANYYPLKDPTGQSIGVNIVVQEITDRKRAEAALIESEEQFRSTFDQAAVGIAHVSLDGRWLAMNSKLCEIVGYMEAELLDLTFQNITHPEDLSINLEYAHQLIAGERQTYTMEKRYIHKLGHIVWVNLTVSIRLDPAGTPLHFISVIEAIDDRKRLELDLQAQTVELTKTTALIELRNQELHRFSHTVSHDLKAPLRGISNLATWISEDLPPTVDPDIFANLDLMRARIARMNSLIDGLLEYARVGSTSTSLATFSVEQLLAEIVDSLSIPDSFVVELPAELPPITTHPVLLSQVLANLIGNAYKHHDSPGETLRERTDGRIQVTAQPDAKLWTFRVTDNGRGIAPENQAEVFDIFKTLSDTDQNSTGIGLSIVKKLVETHGGEITLESQLGVGTTFNFTWMPEQTR